MKTGLVTLDMLNSVALIVTFIGFLATCASLIDWWDSTWRIAVRSHPNIGLQRPHRSVALPVRFMVVVGIGVPIHLKGGLPMRLVHMAVPFLALIAGCTPTPTLSAVQLTPSQISLVQTGVRAILKDPDSARFGVMAAAQNSEMLVVCGWVNAKNSFGGYTGEEAFWGRLAGSTFTVDNIGGSSEVIMHRCRRRGVQI
jgi:hypothetical protein